MKRTVSIIALMILLVTAGLVFADFDITGVWIASDGSGFEFTKDGKMYGIENGRRDPQSEVIDYKFEKNTILIGMDDGHFVPVSAIGMNFVVKDGKLFVTVPVIGEFELVRK